jgi:hypothetical protein
MWCYFCHAWRWGTKLYPRSVWMYGKWRTACRRCKRSATDRTRGRVRT